jgi:hypothetical protein
VDSSLALRLLQAAGHDVTAFYLQIWFQEDFRNYWDACPWEEDLAICQQVQLLRLLQILTGGFLKLIRMLSEIRILQDIL